MRCEALSLEKRWPGLRVVFDALVEDGRSLALLGPSGSGKSTALRLLAGLLRPDAGRLLLGERDASGLPARSRGLGVVFQDFALFPHLTVRDNVAYGLAVRGIGRRERRLKAEALLERLGLAGFAKRDVASLSGGEQQRVALARALAIEPAAVLLDEPLSSLDPSLRKRLRGELRELQRREGFTAIAVTHDIEEAFALGDEVALMVAGRVVQTGRPEEVWALPVDAEAARFLGRGSVLPVLDVEPAPAGLVRVRTAIGSLVCAERAGLNLGGRLSVLLAADALLPADSAPSSGAHGSALEGLVVSADFAGSITRLNLLSPSGQAFRAETRGLAPPPGARAVFFAPIEACILVPEQNEGSSSR